MSQCIFSSVNTIFLTLFLSIMFGPCLFSLKMPFWLCKHHFLRLQGPSHAWDHQRWHPNLFKTLKSYFLIYETTLFKWAFVWRCVWVVYCSCSIVHQKSLEQWSWNLQWQLILLETNMAIFQVGICSCKSYRIVGVVRLSHNSPLLTINLYWNCLVKKWLFFRASTYTVDPCCVELIGKKVQVIRGSRQLTKWIFEDLTSC